LVFANRTYEMPGAKTFEDYFKESMKSVGCPVPPTTFTTITTATAMVNAMIGAVAKLGAGATLAELWVSVGIAGAGKAGAAAAAVEIGVAAGAITAAAYVGACIGALLYATQMSLGLDPFASNVPAEIGKTLTLAKKLGISLPMETQTMLAQAARSNAARPDIGAATA
jgi:hypothetical protein